MRILLTGPPGCGKSTLVQELILALKGKKLAGIVTPEIRDGGRTGFRIVDLASGEEEVLASVQIATGPRVGKYGVNVAGADRIAGLFCLSLDGAECLFLDEIGKMELYSPRFREACERAFASGKPLVAVVHRSLVDQYKDKGELIRVVRDRIGEICRRVLAALA